MSSNTLIDYFGYEEDSPTTSETRDQEQLWKECTKTKTRGNVRGVPKKSGSRLTGGAECDDDECLSEDAGSFLQREPVDMLETSSSSSSDESASSLRNGKRKRKIIKRNKQKKNKKGTDSGWIKLRNFETVQLAQGYIQADLSEGGFKMSKNNSYPTKLGNVHKYHCGGRFRYGCSYEAKAVVYDVDGEGVEVYSQYTHSHGHVVNEIAGLPQHHRDLSVNIIKDGFMPGCIHRKIVDASPDTKVKISQVQNSTKYLKRKLLGSLLDNTVGALNQFCSDNEMGWDSELHAVAVLPGWEANGQDLLEDAADVCFTLSTKQLLTNAIKQSNGKLCSFVDADSTYNLCDNGYPF